MKYVLMPEQPRDGMVFSRMAGHGTDIAAIFDEVDGDWHQAFYPYELGVDRQLKVTGCERRQDTASTNHMTNDPWYFMVEDEQ